ncbi:MAG: D-glycerate dehydrogenase [Brockia lithotrophica]|nr:D-glycerate dehydrogenase [Brockia lithotrophica]
MRVFVARRIPEEFLEPLRAHAEVEVWPEADVPPPPDVLRAKAQDADGLITLLTDRVDRSLLAAAPRLRVVANLAVGYNNVDVAAACERGVVVTYTPDVLTEATADLVFLLVLGAARRVREAIALVEENRWRGWAPFADLGVDLAGKTLGIWGMGRIGTAVARRARGFGMEVVYHNRRPREDSAVRELGARYVSFPELLALSDVLVVLVPYAPELRHRIGAEEVRAMKRGAILVVASRGGIVNEAAVAEALATGHLFAAGFDVYEVEPLPADSPLRRAPRILLLPHIGSATEETRAAMARLAVDNVVRVLRGLAPRTPVPECADFAEKSFRP